MSAPRSKKRTAWALTGAAVAVAVAGLLFTDLASNLMDEQAVEAQAQVTVETIEALLTKSSTAPVTGNSQEGTVRTGGETSAVRSVGGNIHWEVVGNGHGYCVSAWSDNSSAYPARNPLRYSSTDEGVLPRGRQCVPARASTHD